MKPKRRKHPTSFTLPHGVFRMLNELVEALDYSDRSTLVEVLIREEFERRHGRLTVPETPVNSPPPKAQTHSESVLNDAQGRAQSTPSSSQSGSAMARFAARARAAAERRVGDDDLPQ